VSERKNQGLDSNGTKRRALVAVDLGAESCRTSLLRWTRGIPEIQVVYRFANAAGDAGNGLRWDIDKIRSGVEEGLRQCAVLAPEGIAAIGVDGWAVDYVRLRPDGEPVANPFCYRDPRTIEAQKKVNSKISTERLYELTGIQVLPLNTLYQLCADGQAGMNQAIPWTNLPEFVLSWLGGRRVSEYTNATHTQLLNSGEYTWCREIFEAAGLDLTAAPPVVAPGTQIGCLQGALAALPEFRETRLIAPACHDTASAVAGIPAHGDDWAFISSGTWSLVGGVLDALCVCEAAREKNFSNEGGVGGKTYFLKNVNGMWLLRQCMEQWRVQGRDWNLGDLLQGCEMQPEPACLLDVDDGKLLLPGNMPALLNVQLRANGHATIPEEPAMAPKVASLIFHSLAARYAVVLQDLTNITGKKLNRLYIVGGGSRNGLLNRLTARATGLEVLLGSTESTTIGNFAIQLAALEGDYSEGLGVSSSAVAKWAETLTAAPLTA
jgi:rhamnulokinase